MTSVETNIGEMLPGPAGSYRDDHPLIHSQIGEIAYDNFGGVIIRYHEVDGTEDPEKAIEFMESEGFEARRCQHEGDCCGHYYPRKLEVASEIRISGAVVLKQEWHQNV